MMFVNADQFPAPFGVVLARWTWQYRSEFAPPASPAVALGVGPWLHLGRPHCRPYLIVGVAVAELAMGAFGVRAWFAPLAEGAYPAVVAVVAHVWLMVASHPIAASRVSRVSTRNRARWEGGKT